MTQLAAEVEKEAEAAVHVVARLGKVRAHDEDPAAEGRRDEQLVLVRGGEALLPRAGPGVGKAKRGLDELRVAALDGEPSGRRAEHPRMAAAFAAEELRVTRQAACGEAFLAEGVNHEDAEDDEHSEDDPDHQHEQERDDVIVLPR